MLCDESLEDYEKKKSFLNQLGLSSTIKEENSCDSFRKYEHFKISLDEIIVIDDENDDSENVCIDENVKLLSKKQFLKVSQLKNQSKGTRAKSKKLLMLDFSSPLGQKIDFSMSVSKNDSSKSSLLKSPLDYVNSYEKWCLTNSKVKYNVMKTKLKICKNGSSNLSKVLCEYNFRKRQKCSRGIKLSDEAKMLQQAMKSCFVNIPRIEDPQVCVPISQSSISCCDTINTSSECSISNSFVEVTGMAMETNSIRQESSASVCSETSPIADDTSILKNGLHFSEDCEVLIREVYSLAPGASPELPSHLVEMGQNLLNSCKILKVPGECSVTSTNSCFSLSSYLAGSADKIVIKEPGMENMKKRNGFNDCIIDLCGVDNEDFHAVDLNSDNRLLTNHALNDKVSQTHETVSSQSGLCKNAILNLPELFSFLCRICNKVVKCYGSYQNDMRDHYEFHHNITNVNLVPCEENGKTVWKLIETNLSNPVESQTSRCHKRKKDISQSENVLQNSASHAMQNPPTFLPRFAFNINQSASMNSNQPTFLNSRTYPSINNQIPTKLITTSDVICID